MTKNHLLTYEFLSVKKLGTRRSLCRREDMGFFVALELFGVTLMVDPASFGGNSLKIK